ncbi:MAG: flippase [Lactobacillus sp.]
MKLIKNYLYNAGYQLLVLLLPFITAPYIGRVLKPYGVGVNSYTNSIVQWFVLLAGVGISYYGNRQIAYVRSDRAKLSQTFWEIQLLKTLTTVIAFVLFFIFLRVYRQYTWYLWLQSLNVVAGVLDISWFYMGIEDFRSTVTRNTIVKLITVVAIFIFVKTPNDIGTYIVLLAVGLILGNLSLWLKLPKYLDCINFKGLRPLIHLRPTIAMFIPQIATQIYLILNKNMLGIFSGLTAAGFYNQADTMIKMVLAIVTATGTVMLPHVANAFARGEKEQVKRLLYSSFNFVSLLAVAMMFGMMAISRYLGLMFYGPGFGPVGQAMAAESIVILMIGWSNAIGMQYLLPVKRVKDFTWSVTLGAVVNIILNFPLIKLWGLMGAIWATVISETMVTGYQLYVVRHQLEFKQLFADLGKYLLAGVVMFVPVYWLDQLWQPKTLQLLPLLRLLGIIGLGVVLYGLVLLATRPRLLGDAINLLRNRHTNNQSEE